VQRRLRTAWATADPDQAAAKLEQLARGLARQPSAPLALKRATAEEPAVLNVAVGA
jgi:hypothetical protein